MKTRILCLCGLLILSGGLFSGKVLSKDGGQNEPVLKVYCTPELQPLTSGWVQDYMKSDPGSRIELKVLDQKQGVVLESGALYFTSTAKDVPGEVDNSWRITVGRDIFVPVINLHNAGIGEIVGNGFTMEELKYILSDPKNLTWGSLIPGGTEQPIHIYITNDELVLNGVKSFAGVESISPAVATICEKDELIRSIQQDPNALGFCKLADIIGPEKEGLAENIRLLPVDRNGNGKVDYIENIYEDPGMFLRGVWIGKYSRSLYNDIQVVTDQQPSGAVQTAFLRWIMTSGQAQLELNGFSDLTYSERQSKLDRINNISLNIPSVEEVNSVPKLIFLISLAILFAGLILGTVIRFGRGKSTPLLEGPKSSPGVFDENTISVPRGLYFDKTHTWAFMEKDGLIRVGIDDFLHRVTGRITRVDMKQQGDIVKKGEKLVSIAHRGKQLNIYSPVSGIIRDCNRALNTNADLINSSPFSDGWVYMVEPANWAGETRILSMADNYIKWLYEEFTRLRDFLSVNLNSDRKKYSSIVLQDGGVLKQNILEDLGPELWEDFQTEFLDTSK